MKQKKLMLLGGIRYLLPVIKAAHEQGYYVITADYLPDNIAHKYSDEYVNVSIIDKEAVLKVAQEKQIDGLMSFGVDPGVVSAAYVQDKMGLPSFGPYESVRILQNKDLFRSFLKEHGFNVPWAKGYASAAEAWEDRLSFTYPVIVKPTDSAGSKGVTRVNDEDTLQEALSHAAKHALSGRIIVERFIEKKGCSSDSDSFSKDGEMVFISFNAQQFDALAANPYTPSAYYWPSSFTDKESACLKSDIQRLITILGMTTCLYNIEARIGVDGLPYIMELTPRGGGNRLSEVLRYATGVDMITAITRYTVGDTVSDISQKPFNGHWAEVILHADADGRFAGLDITPAVAEYIVETDLWVHPGQQVTAFHGANDAIGTLVMRFDTAEEMRRRISDVHEWIRVRTIEG